MLILASISAMLLAGLVFKHQEDSIQMDRGEFMKMVGAVRTSGKGTMRRKKMTIHKTTTADNKRLQVP